MVITVTLLLFIYDLFYLHIILRHRIYVDHTVTLPAFGYSVLLLLLLCGFLQRPCHTFDTDVTVDYYTPHYRWFHAIRWLPGWIDHYSLCEFYSPAVTVPMDGLRLRLLRATTFYRVTYRFTLPGLPDVTTPHALLRRD